MSARLKSLLAMLARGQDSALLQFSLGNEYLSEQDFPSAAEHFKRAVELDPDYSAAWKLLGTALARANRTTQAIEAYRQGIQAAETKGDRQAAKEMTVFLRRLEKDSDR